MLIAQSQPICSTPRRSTNSDRRLSSREGGNEELAAVSRVLVRPRIQSAIREYQEQLIATVNLPNARYEEVEFKLHKNTDAGAMNGKSIWITGTIDGKPFIFWHDTDEEFEIDFENAATDLVINGNTAAMVINLQLDRLFSTVKGGVNLSLAMDGDGDGVIEINPGSIDNDGNKELAHAIKTLLEDVTDFIDDKD